MKTLVTLLLLFASITTFAQDSMYSDAEKEAKTSATGTAPQKKDNIIIISTGLDSEEAFIKWGRHLAQSGYSIDESDKDFLVLTTKPKDTSRLNFNYIISSSVNEGGTIKITMRWQLKSSMLAGTSETGYYDWEYKNEGFHVAGIVYKDVMQVVNSFGDYPVSFAKQ